MTDIDRPAELLNPISGELVPVGDLDAVGAALQQLRDAEAKLKVARQAFGQVFVEESRRRGSRTFEAAGVKLEVSAPDELQWDVELLEQGLRDLGLAEETLNELIVTTVERKVNGTVARKVAGADPAYKQVIEAAKTRIPQTQYVSVKT